MIDFKIKVTTPRGVFGTGAGLATYIGEVANSLEKIIGEPEMDSIAKIVEWSNKDNIRNQVKASGASLGEWAESTRKARMRKGGSMLKLLDTRDLIDSIASDRSGKLKRTVEAKSSHAGYVQFAPSGKWTFFGFSKKASEKVGKYLIEKVRDAIKRKS